MRVIDQASWGLRPVVGEIIATLEDAGAALGAHLRNPGERQHLQFCQAHLHQIAGSLTLAESRGGTLLVEAMEAVVAALLRGDVAHPQEAGEAVAAAAAVLPGYLERSLAAGGERPAALIGVLNDLRASLRQPLASEGGLFTPQLAAFEDRSLALPPARDHTELAALCRKLRQIYQHALLGLLKGEQVERQLELLAKVGQRVRELFPGSRRDLLWELAGRMLGAFGPQPSLGAARRQLLWQLDRDLRACGELQDSSAEQPPIATELFKNVLYYAMAAEPAAEWVAADFGMQAAAIGGEDGDPWSTPELAVRRAVGRALVEELATLRHLGEEQLAAGASLPAAASRLAAPLRRLRDTLTAAGLARGVAAAERAAQSLGSGPPAAGNGADPWAAWAESIEVLERLIQGWVATGVASDDPQALRAALVVEARNAVITAIRDLLDDIKGAVAGRASAAGDPVRLAGAVAAARQIQQVLLLIEQEPLREVLAACAACLGRLQDQAGTISRDGIDRLADCLSAAEYHLELLAQGDGEAGARALAQAEQRAARLRAALPPQEPPAAAVAPGANASPAPALGVVPASFAAESVDEEIRGIFVEEAREVLAALAALEPGDGARPPPALRELRRGFHTLKGSGRTVGAGAIGTLCWGVEAVLNRILEGDLAWSGAVAEPVAAVLARLPALVDEFASGGGAALGSADAVLHARLLALAEPAAVAAAPEVADEFAATRSAATPQPVAPGTDDAAAVACALSAEELHHETLAQIEILERFCNGPLSAAGGARVEELARAVHTLIGCCARSGDSGLARALRRFEELLTVHGERGLAPGAGLWAALSRLAVAGRAAIGAAAPVDLSGVQADLERIHAGLADGRSRERLRALMAGGLGELLTAAEWLDRAGADGLPAARVAPLLAELEELADSAAVAQLPELARLAGLLRAGGRQLLEGRCRPVAWEIFQHGVAQLLLLLDAVAAALPPPEISAELMAQLGAMAEAAVEAAGQASVTAVDAAADEEPGGELLAIFLEEAADLCEQAEQAIAGRQLDTLKRCLHTLKGSARMAGCSALGELCHEFETLVESVDSATAPEPLFDTCLAWLDRIEREREHIARRRAAAALPGAEATPDQPTRPAAMAAPEPSRAVPMVAAAVPVQPPPSFAAWRALPVAAGPSIPPPWRQHSPRSSGGGLRQAGDEPREMVKIAAPILANLANLADETSVSRSRIEQQLQQFHFQLEEMETTVQRFHDQVRQLGMETEAQILFRREQLTAEGSEDQFDPLEMDRYSTLQHLSRALEESASDLQDLKETLLTKVRETEALLIHQARVNRDLQENLSLTRMVPFSRVVPRLRRIVRQTSSELGKPVELVLSNIEGELDRAVLERVVPSLEHLIRNAIDHGIEAPRDREGAGKPATGQISITFAREAGDVVIKVADDGRGLDLDVIRDKARALGLLGADAPSDDRELAQLIFHPGFSTAAKVSRVSGRGIGMDVVDSELRQLGGSVTPLSRRGQGVEFTLRVPFTISVNRALLMKAGRERYGTLVNSVAGVVRLDAGQLEQLSRRADAGFEHGGNGYRVCRLEELVGNPEPPLPAVPGRAALVLTKDAREPVAVLVDALEPSQEVVVKSLGPQFARVRGLSGATVLGDGQVVPILDLNALVDHAMPRIGAATGVAASPAAVPLDAPEAAANILVVDDSVTMRKATARLLERQGYKVITARDGVEAMQFLQEVTPDLMLLDIEMPRMDGFEVVRQVRATARLARLPIIMITSRSGDKHRGKAMALGVDHYLGKPYQEDHLLAVVAASLPGTATGVPRHESGPGR